MRNLCLSLLAGILLSLVSTSVSAQEPSRCEMLAFQKAQAELGFARLFAEYPGTTTGLLFCMAAASEQKTQSDKVGAFAVCTITVCLLSSMQNCTHVAATTGALAIQLNSNKDSRQALGCAN